MVGRSHGGLKFFCVGVWWMSGVVLQYWGKGQVQVLKRGGKYVYIIIILLYRKRGSAFYFSTMDGFTV